MSTLITRLYSAETVVRSMCAVRVGTCMYNSYPRIHRMNFKYVPSYLSHFEQTYTHTMWKCFLTTSYNSLYFLYRTRSVS